MTLCRPSPPPLLRLLVPLVMLLPLAVVTAAGAVEEPSLCMTDQPEFVSRTLVWFGETVDIRLQVSERAESHLVAWVFKLFLKEIYGYSNTSLVVVPDRFSMDDYLAVFSDCPSSDTQCLNTTCDSQDFDPPCQTLGRIEIPDVLMNLQAWTPANFDFSSWSENGVLHVGRLGPSARIGWFLQERITNTSSSILDHWRAFRLPSTAEAFNYTETECDQLKPFLWRGDRYNCDDPLCQDGLFVPDTCRGIHCAVLLASTFEYSGYAIDMIVKYKLQVKVFWVGDHLEDIVRRRTDDNRPVLFAHHSPSRLALYAPYTEVAFPPCSNSSLCHTSDRYLRKLAWHGIRGTADTAYKVLENFHLSQSRFEDLLSLHAQYPTVDPGTTACLWMRRNNDTLIQEWLGGTRPINEIHLGGIFPITGNSYQDPGVVPAVMMAVDAINRNKTLLQHFHVNLLSSDGQCSADVVMKTFINYLRLPDILPQMAGVLGPACSNTLEPIVGVARHFRVVVISFSAEGVLMTNRTQYPYFFRTIGENKQFRFVYKELLKQLQFKRVASLTEAGQKYSEYISLLHDMLQASGVTFVSNRKFTSDTLTMAPYLKDLKEQNARIIIADMYQEAARDIMCEAYHQNMTAKEGYLWFLPEWFTGGWYNTPAFAGSVKCTTSQVMQALDGHLALAHADFTSDDSMMQDNMTVGKWKELYKIKCDNKSVAQSKYASYAYDATWTYALALDKLLREQPSRHQNLHTPSTVKRLVELLNATDFHGVSGRLRFAGPSRISVTEIKQWRRDGDQFGYHVVGRFFPNDSLPEGGRLELDESKIRWMTPGGHRPVDGSSMPCELQPLADLLGIDCQEALIIVNVVGLLALIAIFVICVRFYKRRYERKMQRLREMGLGNWAICSPEWEVKRDKIVMNRKLGEGAFGTVYGGEAIIDRESRERGETATKKRVQSTAQVEEEWCSVAVKTLKLNSTMEEKRDFLSEAEVMKKFDHTNIIQLLGVCTLNEPMLTVMEFMLYGDLKTFLLARRNPKDECGEISDKKLTSMARDVACALSYLADRKFVHRDVACRNCLVGANYVVKLADFGMTRSMCENNYYKFHREGMLPVRWMAPESLAEGIFTPMSDIWSYGVLLFEITTFGGFPFQGFSNGQVLDRVRSGNHVEIPPGVKPELADLLKTCWSTDPDDRPEARRLVELLGLQYPRLISPCLDVPLSVVQLDGPQGKQAAGRHCSLTLSSRPRPAAHRAPSCEKPESAEARYLLARPPSPVESPSPPPSPPSKTAADANGYATKYVVLDHRSAPLDNGRNITL